MGALRLVVTALVVLSLPFLASVGLARAEEPLPYSVDQLRRAEQLNSVFENESLEYAYDYITYLDDGRGYTAGRVGFTTYDGDLLAVLEPYVAAHPKAPIARYLPRLRWLAENGSPSVHGLAGFKPAWRLANRDPELRAAQDARVHEIMILPAIAYLRELGATSALAYAVLFDTVVQHGRDEDPDGTPALIARATRAAGGTPLSGVREATWLRAFLRERHRTLLHSSDPESRREWRKSAPRALALAHLIDEDNFELQGPIHVKVFDFDGLIP